MRLTMQQVFDRMAMLGFSREYLFSNVLCNETWFTESEEAQQDDGIAMEIALMLCKRLKVDFLSFCNLEGVPKFRQ